MSSRRISLRRTTLLAVLCFLAGQCRCAPAQDAATSAAEQEFLRQLTERGFFDLAEEHCQSVLERAVSPFEKAEWTMRLCRVLQSHAWAADSASRAGLLNRAIEELTEFLNTSTAFPVLDLRGRLQLVSALKQSLRMSLPIAEAGHLFGNRLPTPGDWDTDAVDSHLETLKRCQHLLEEIQVHLSRVRREVDTDAARQIRDETRVLTGEVLSLRWRLTADPQQRAELRAAGESALDQSFRTTTGVLRHRAAWLLAELALYADSAAAFSLRLQAIDPDIKDNGLFRPEFLQIRRLLFDQNATEALKLARKTQPETLRQRAALMWLQQEALLGIVELAAHLDDRSLAADADRQFAELLASVRQTVTGVFLDAVEQTARRFELVRDAGPEVASLIEKIARDRAAGNLQQAVARIDTALQRLPVSGADRSRAFLNYEAGQILAQLKRWNAAEESLNRAVAHFRSVGMSSQEAAADLIRIYCLAQQLANKKDVTEQQYIEALNQHLSRYGREPTAATARNWLARVVSDRDPLRAAEIRLEQARYEDHPQKKIEFLQAAGHRLFDDHASRAADSYRNAVMQFRQLVNELTADRSAFPESDTAAIELMAVILSVETTSPDDIDWASVLNDVTRLISAPGAQRADLPPLVQSRLLLVHLAGLVRTGSDPTLVSEVRRQVARLTGGQRLDAIRFLARQTSGRRARSGDGLIYQVLAVLLKGHLADRNSKASAEELLPLLPITVRTASVTGAAELLDALLANLEIRRLTEQQIADAVALMSAAANDVTAADGPNKNHRVLMKFWNRVRSISAQGSDLWLEASLQMASILLAGGDRDGAARQLAIVETLYPDWGNGDRKRRAEKLRARLSPSEGPP